MSKIRADFFGSVIVHASGVSHMLVAGDEVPDGANIDARLLEENATATPYSKQTQDSNEQHGDDAHDAEDDADANEVEPKTTTKRGGSRARKSN